MTPGGAHLARIGMGLGLSAFGAEGGPPFPLLPPAEAPSNQDMFVAFGAVKLNSAYTGPCLRVRRESDNAETDVGFVPAPWNPEEVSIVDMGAISTFCGSSDGYMPVCYNQGGANMNNAQRATAAGQPKIYDAATDGAPGYTPNGVPCFLGQGETLHIDGGDYNGRDHLAMVAHASRQWGDAFITTGSRRSGMRYGTDSGILYLGMGDGNNPSKVITPVAPLDKHLVAFGRWQSGGTGFFRCTAGSERSGIRVEGVEDVPANGNGMDMFSYGGRPSSSGILVAGVVWWWSSDASHPAMTNEQCDEAFVRMRRLLGVTT